VPANTGEGGVERKSPFMSSINASKSAVLVGASGEGGEGEVRVRVSGEGESGVCVCVCV
jgi:hypothetical protein